jgi:precorrin-3B methylase
LEYIDRELAIIKVMLKHMSSETCDLRKKEVAHKFTVGEIIKSEFDMSTRVIIGYDAACVPATVSTSAIYTYNRQCY